MYKRQSLTDDELALLESLAHPTRFASGETLFTQGREAHSVYNVTAGVVRLYKLLSDGRRQVVGFALPGDFLGPVSYTHLDVYKRQGSP